VSTARSRAILDFFKEIDRLDYYEVLGISKTACASSIRTAYYEKARLFHPDGNRESPEALKLACRHIAQRLNESYCVLRDPGRRQAYDEERTLRKRLRVPLAETQRESLRRSLEAQTGSTAKGLQYAERGLACARTGDWKGAARNFQTALTFEPNNPHLRRRLGDARRQIA